jgi:superfamily II DNA/RNA helicase
MKFTEFGLDDQLIEALSYMGFEEATPIQEQAIPKVLAGHDLIACAQTGTGKTAAFLLPVLHQLAKEREEFVKCLILVPTRELAIQIDQQVQGLGYFSGISTLLLYGGSDGADWATQKRALQGGADIVVATPGCSISVFMRTSSRLSPSFPKSANRSYLAPRCRLKSANWPA